MENKKIPIEMNKTYELKVYDQNNFGDGVGKIDNFTIFIENALIGESGTVLITDVKKNYGRGKMVQIKDKSIDRIDSLCNKFGECGGCDLQHQKYESQVLFKKKKIEDALTRIGKFDNVVVDDVVGMDNSLNYRNKAIFHIFNNNHGFYQKKTNNIIDINECAIINPLINKTYKVLIDYLKIDKLVINKLMIKVGVNTNEIMVVIYADYKQNKFDNLVNYLPVHIQELKTIIVDDNAEEHILYGDGFIKEKLLDKYFKISAKSFFQVNTNQAENLYRVIKSYINDDDKLILDLYTGTGSIALSIVNSHNKVIGIEVVEDAVRDAKVNAKMNDINNAEFILGDVNRLERVIKEKKIKPDVVILDPPRKGADVKTLDIIKELAPKKILYTSCDVTTLARDLKYIIDNNYVITQITPIDMFPNTMHVETVVLMSRKDK